MSGLREDLEYFVSMFFDRTLKGPCIRPEENFIQYWSRIICEESEFISECDKWQIAQEGLIAAAEVLDEYGFRS